MAFLDKLRVQKAPPPLSSTPAPCVGERHAAHHARKVAIKQSADARLEELRQMTADARVEGQQALARAEAEFENAEKQLDQAVAAVARERLFPILARMDDDPRAAGKELCAAWAELDARCRSEIGEPLSESFLAYGLAQAAGVEDAFLPRDDAFPSEFWNQIDALKRVIRNGNRGLVVEEAARRAISLASTTPQVPRRDIVQFILSCSTWRRQVGVLVKVGPYGQCALPPEAA